VSRGSVAFLSGVALAIAMLIAGCGSGGETTTTTLSKAELIEQGDTICLQANGRRLAGMAPYIAKAKEGKPLPPQAKQEELVVSVVLPPFQEEAEELAELVPPKGDEKEVQALVTAIEEAVKRGKADPSSILSGASSQFGEAEELGRKYGFKQCGRS
jgi:hypothetical protein